MISWLVENPIIAGVITTLLMWLDRTLTIAQEKERRLHYYRHYESYPVNTIEGNPFLRKDVEKSKWINVRHLVLALLLGGFVAVYLSQIPKEGGMIFIGFIWGIFLIVNTQHLSNLIAYRMSRKGVHGKIWMHQRTGYYVQSGRYFATFIFLLILSILVENLFLYGVTLSALLSSLRMFIWMRKVPRINKDDLSPENYMEP